MAELAFRNSPPQLCIDDDKMATGTKLVPDLPQNRAVLRHRVVGEAEEYAIEQLDACVIRGIAFNQEDIRPVLTPA